MITSLHFQKYQFAQPTMVVGRVGPRIWRFIIPIHLSHSDWWFLIFQQQGRPESSCWCSSNILVRYTLLLEHPYIWSLNFLMQLPLVHWKYWHELLSHKHVQEHSFETIYFLKDHTFRDFVFSCDRAQGCEESACAEISAAMKKSNTFYGWATPNTSKQSNKQPWTTRKSWSGRGFLQRKTWSWFAHVQLTYEISNPWELKKKTIPMKLCQLQRIFLLGFSLVDKNISNLQAFLGGKSSTFFWKKTRFHAHKIQVGPMVFWTSI